MNLASPTAELDVASLYQRYGGLVFRRVRKFYSAEVAEEVMAEVWARVVASAHTFRRDSSPATWLYQLTTRHCMNRKRDAARRAELLAKHGQPAWGRAVSPASQEDWTLLRQIWRSVDEELVMIGMYHYQEGMSQAEIAELLGCSRRTVGNRLDTLKLQLQQKAEEAS